MPVPLSPVMSTVDGVGAAAGRFPVGSGVGGKNPVDAFQQTVVRHDAVRRFQGQDPDPGEVGRHPAEKRGVGAGQDEIEPGVGQQAEGGRAVARRGALEPPPLEENRQGFRDGGIILDDQKGTAHVRGSIPPILTNENMKIGIINNDRSPPPATASGRGRSFAWKGESGSVRGSSSRCDFLPVPVPAV